MPNHRLALSHSTLSGIARTKARMPMSFNLAVLAPAGLVLSCGAALAQSANPTCSQGPSSYNCTISAPTYPLTAYTVPLTLSSGALAVDNYGSFDLQLSGAANYGLDFIAQGVAGANSSTVNPPNGGGGGYQNTTMESGGTFSLTGAASLTGWVDAVLAQSTGGTGGNYTGDGGLLAGAGGAGGSAFLGNHQPVTVQGTFPNGVTALDVESTGGSGGYGATGGTGGAGGSAQAENYATVSMGTAATPVTGAIGAAVIAALSNGGGGGDSNQYRQGNGGAGGTASVYNDAPVSLYWNWQGSGPSGQVYGLLAQSTGSSVSLVGLPDENGGAGGAAGQATIRLVAAGDVAVTVSNGAPPATLAENPPAIPALDGAAVASISQGGAGGITEGGADNTFAGNGGDAGVNVSGNPQMSIYGATVTVSGNAMAAALVENLGGAGGDGNGVAGDNSWGTAGGNGGYANSVLGTLFGNDTISSAGAEAPGLVAAAIGGNGGDGATYYNTFGHDAGNGGVGGGTSSVTLTASNTTLNTVGDDSAGILAVAQGGSGGNGGDRSGGSGDAGGGGNAGAAGGVSTDLQAGTKIATDGSYSPGVEALAQGGNGGNGGAGNVNFAGSPRPGGNGGNAGSVGVSLQKGASITTAGSISPGLAAISIGGNGGTGNSSSNVASSNGGPGGTGGNTVSTSAFNAGNIVTLGDNSVGILVDSASGAGGVGGNAGGIYGNAGPGGAAGTVGDVSATNAAGGTITTGGQYAMGILAQSLGGAGGNGGGLNFANTGQGGNGGTAAAGGSVDLTNEGAIATSGEGAIGAVDLSVGGNGGSGASGDGLLVIGGSGGLGGDAGDVQANAGGDITTAGALAVGLAALSIGGGGGIGGDATSYSPIFTVAVGGTGGDGGDGATVNLIASQLKLSTGGSNAIGVLAGSVGGGGGKGGSAFGLSVSAGFGGAVAVGGRGGDGGDGGSVLANFAQTDIVTASTVQDATDPVLAPDDSLLEPLPVDSYGIMTLSVGGGGGVGGSALAQSYVQDLTIPQLNVGVAISATYALGGDGGNGGTGGDVTTNLSEGVDVLTYGNGADALVAQSMGGGGGDGGDSSATSTAYGFKTSSKLLGQKNLNLDLAISVGGDGGGGGNGGDVNVTLAGTDGVADPNAPGSPVSIVTLGDDADGALAQSIGGGGGNAGLGSGSTQNGTSAATAAKIVITVGSDGGAGGVGGNVQFSAFPGTEIATYGDSADGVELQSVGGGGGDSSGGSFQFGLPSYDTVSGYVFSGGKLPYVGGVNSSVTLNLGTTGAGGGNGGAVTGSFSGAQISTSGQDAIGIMAESTGGGGGVGGSAGSNGSSDDPNVVEDLRAGKKFANAVLGFILDVTQVLQETGNYTAAFIEGLTGLFPSVNFAISLGGSGGAGGNGGTVASTISNSVVQTTGDYADALEAQSIGGGGGDGGAAVAGGASGLGNYMKININFALGGSAGSAGNGGLVQIGLDSDQLLTKGYAAYAIFEQSVGGGGGTVGSAETNSNGLISLGASTTSAAPAGGNGGTVTLSQSSGGGISSIETFGDAAPAVVLQSIGGGGGVGGDGFTVAGGLAGNGTSLSLSAGGGDGAYGNGGAVTFDPNNLPLLKIQTSGIDSFGILAQSVGGGGGIAFEQPGTAGTYTVGGSNSTAANGGTVSVALRDGSSITTTGNGSYAIFAQSVGGGGGITGLAAGTTTLYIANSTNGPGSPTSGTGGAVTVNTGDSTISASGAGAYGIFAQSVGAGGGIKSTNAGNGVIAGSTGVGGSSGAGGDITIVQNGSLTASGTNATGIFAQSVGNQGTFGGAVNITINGSVEGGTSGQGYGVWIYDPQSGLLRDNTITINAAGSLGSLSDQAIMVAGLNTTNVNNYGTVTGSYTLTQGTFTNETGGTYIPAGAENGDLVNAGLIEPAATNHFEVIPVNGNFQQTATGVYAPNVQFGTHQADMLVVTGNAQLEGSVRPIVDSVLPRISLPILTVVGRVSGTLSAIDSVLFAYTIADPAENTATVYTIANTSANFDPSGLALTPLEQNIARALLTSWKAGGNAAFGTFYADLEDAAGRGLGGYAVDLANLAPQAMADYAARETANMTSFADDLDGCTRNGGASVVGQNGHCAWFTLSGGATAQAGSNGAARFGLDQTTYAIGGETRVMPNLYLDVALAYQTSWLSTANNLQKGFGQSGFGGAGLRYEMGPWTFSGGLFGSAGSYSTSRVINLPGEQTVIDGSPTINSIGVRAGTAYLRDFGSFYLRPRLTLDGIYAAVPGYTESGSSVDVTRSKGNSQGIFVATPGIEIGKQFALNDGLAVHMSLLVAASLQSSNDWTQSYSFIHAPSGSGDFDTVVAMDTAAARISAAVQLIQLGRYSLRAEYDGAYSGQTNVNAGSLAFHATF